MKRWLALALVLSLIFTATGCSFIFRKAGEKIADKVQDQIGDVTDKTGEKPGETPGGATATPDPGSAAGKDNAPLVDGNFYEFKNALDLIRSFTEVEFTIYSTRNNQTKTSDFSYTNMGRDTVDGKQVDHLMFMFDSDVIEAWVSDSGEYVKAKIGDMELTGDMAKLGEGAVMATMLPMTYSDGFREAFTTKDGWSGKGWVLKDKSKTVKNLGAGNLQIDRYEFEITVMNKTATYFYEVAKVGGKYIFVHWEYAAADEILELEVTRLIPR